MNQDQFIALQEAMKNLSSMKYGTTIELGGTPGDRATGAIVVNRSDFALVTLKWAFVTSMESTAAADFSIDLSLQNTKRFHKSPTPPMALSFGSPNTSIWDKYAPPILIKIQTTVYIELTNLFAAPVDPMKIQILLVGDEKVQPL